MRKKKTPLSHYCDEWLFLRRSKVKESTLIKYEAILEGHIKPRLRSCPVSGLSSVAVQQFNNALMHEDGLSAKTTRDILTVLSGILKYAARSWPEMPYIEIPLPKEQKNDMRVLSREEQERFTAYLTDGYDLCKFGTMLALLTGLRIGEICALKWKHISLPDRTLRVEGTMQRLRNTGDGAEKTKVSISDPKTFASARVIPLGALALSLCRKYASDDPEAYILTGSPLRFMEPRLLQYHLKCYTMECGLEGVHFHTLRHSFATRCVEVGFEIKSLSEVLGHSSPKITLERYVHSSMELKQENMEKLAVLGY